MSYWLEISLITDPEGAEAAAEALHPFAHQGVAIERLAPGGDAWESDAHLLQGGPVTVRAYIPENDHTAEVRARIEEAFFYLNRIYPGIPAPSFQRVVEQDWAEAWKAHFHPIRVGQHLVIKPAWAELDVQPGDLILELDPGMAFGTGTHPTTQMCLEACELLAKPGLRVLDLGTGSGILAIAAARMGCEAVWAYDVDEIAVKAAQENIARNGFSHAIRVGEGSLGEARAQGPFDLILANLTAGIIQRVLPDGFEDALAPGGQIVFSGVIDSQLPGLEAAFKLHGLVITDVVQLGDWVRLIVEHQQPSGG